MQLKLFCFGGFWNHPPRSRKVSETLFGRWCYVMWLVTLTCKLGTPCSYPPVRRYLYIRFLNDSNGKIKVYNIFSMSNWIKGVFSYRNLAPLSMISFLNPRWKLCRRLYSSRCWSIFIWDFLKNFYNMTLKIWVGKVWVVF